MESIEELEEFIFDKNTRIKKSSHASNASSVTGTTIAKTAAETTTETAADDNDLFFIDTGNDLDSEIENENGSENENSSAELEKDTATGFDDNHGKAAWIDNDQDALGAININRNNRSKKLKRSFGEADIAAHDYEERLRAQFRKIHPTPDWAQISSLDSNSSGSDTAVNSLDDQDLLVTSKNLVQRNLTLNPDKLIVIRAKDANQTEYAKVTIQSISFHPRAPVLLAAGLDKCIRLFHIDGKDNQKLSSFYIKDMPVYSAAFSMDGERIIATGRRNFFYSLNIDDGRNSRINGIRGRQEKSFERSYLSPCNKYLAVLGKDGYILILSQTSKQLLFTCKMNTGVSAIAFSPASTNQMWSLGFDGSVNVWDLDTKLCLHSFIDQGNIRGTAITISSCGVYVAIGSSSGVVNVYQTETALSASMPLPEKAYMNLTTSITTLLFHPLCADLLVIASREVKDALRIIHVGCRKVVKNWPTDSTPLGYVFCCAFSPDGQFLAIGNDKGKVLLYRLEAFVALNS